MRKKYVQEIYKSFFFLNNLYGTMVSIVHIVAMYNVYTGSASIHQAHDLQSQQALPDFNFILQRLTCLRYSNRFYRK